MAEHNNSIVQIFKNEGGHINHIGMGFLVDHEHILTCKHVLDYVFSPEKPGVGKELDLRFPLIPQSGYLKAKVERLSEFFDLTLLKLIDSKPNDAIIMNLDRSDGLFRKDFTAFGITHEHPDGYWVNGSIIGTISSGKIQIEVTSKLKAGHGFSGTPILTDGIDCVVGLILRAIRKIKKLFLQYLLRAYWVNTPISNNEKILASRDKTKTGIN